MLEIKDLAVQYGHHDPTIEHFNLSMKKGEIISVVGESGSGKTTVIRAVLGALPGAGQVTSGDILFHGESLLKNSKSDWRKIRGSKMSMIFQDCGETLNPIRKIGSQYVEYIRTHQSMTKKEAWDKAVSMLTKMRLPDAENIMNSYPYQLSGGMRQRVGIAMAMTFNPELLLADEPTGALDSLSAQTLLETFTDMNQNMGATILMVTHDAFSASYANRILFLRDGAIFTEIFKGSDSRRTFFEKILDVLTMMGGGVSDVR